MTTLPVATVTRLQNQYEPVLRRLQSYDETALRLRPNTGKWSAHEQLAHLGRYQEVFRERLLALLRHPDPVVEPYVADADPHFAAWVQRPTAEIAAELVRGRRALFKQMLILTPEEMARTARHAYLGRLDVAEWTEFFLLHEAHHLLAIFQLLSRLPAPSTPPTSAPAS